MGTTVLAEPGLGGFRSPGTDAYTIASAAAAHYIPIQPLTPRRASVEDAYLKPRRQSDLAREVVIRIHMIPRWWRVFKLATEFNQFGQAVEFMPRLFTFGHLSRPVSHPIASSFLPTSGGIRE
jgi:hypothetical protein